MAHAQSVYKWRPEFQQIYLSVHNWIAKKWRSTSGYKDYPWDRDIVWNAVRSDKARDIAFTFYALFPTHFFKVYHTLVNVVGHERLVEWASPNSRILALDVGCGTGAASAAFIESLAALSSGTNIGPTEVFCIGIDPNIRSLAIYNQLMNTLEKNVSGPANRIVVHHQVRRGGWGIIFERI